MAIYYTLPFTCKLNSASATLNPKGFSSSCYYADYQFIIFVKKMLNKD
jgi:hypothetical protein